MLINAIGESLIRGFLGKFSGNKRWERGRESLKADAWAGPALGRVGNRFA